MSEEEPEQPPKRLHLTDSQRLHWLMLIRCENVGPATFRDLVNHFGSAAAALEALPELISRGGSASRIRLTSRAEAERELEQARQAGARFVGLGEPDYPELLRALEQAPPLICLKGDSKAARRRCVAMVGSRNASVAGMKLATRFAAELGDAGFSIASGLARGVDAAAHKGALATGTLAAFAGGIDLPFPEENRELAEMIVDHGGLLVSEMPMGWRPRAKDFPRRNRIIAGLSLGVLVIEAARRSGSLITARLAGQAGRAVLAVPGSPVDPRAAGTNQLIKEGATLVTEADDVVSALAGSAGLRQPPSFEAGNDDRDYAADAPLNADPSARKRILAALGPSPVEIDDIIRHVGCDPSQVQLVLIELDLAGRLIRHPGNRVSLEA